MFDAHWLALDGPYQPLHSASQFMTERIVLKKIARHLDHLRDATYINIHRLAGLFRRPAQHGNDVLLVEGKLALQHVEEYLAHFPTLLPGFLIHHRVGLERMILEPGQHRHNNGMLGLYIGTEKPGSCAEVLQVKGIGAYILARKFLHHSFSIG